MLKLASFLHAHRLTRPTGVGKHIREMIQCFNQRDDISLHLTAPKRQLAEPPIQAELQQLGLDSIHAIPFSRKLLEISWRILDFPRYDRWAAEADWFYSPAEVYVPTRQLKRAITVHCINWFDPTLPWYRDPGIVSARRRMRPLFSRIAQRSELILTVSDYLNERLHDVFGVAPERMAVVGNGVEEIYFEAGRLPPSSHNTSPYLVVVGGLTTRKNAPLILGMADRLATTMPGLKIKVVGRSEPQYSASSRAADNIEELGYVGVEDGLVELVRHAKALLFPSRCETFGIPTVEAMAAGTVPIVSRYAALPGLVGDAGLIVSDDPNTAADRVVAMIGDEHELTQRATLGRTLAADYTWDRVADRALDAMRSYR